ncbi:hypothetical protein [Levilactobacillus fujinensis]|uniref:Uncharacterized protein n=1 Tax=Levilactobacillus fujinensis TaxID=2486024 RepID=A0ABW1TCN9_9LACO|nr:hypothetical protein [Levilactobacillus fujinensis]
MKRVLLVAVATIAIFGDGWGLIDLGDQTKSAAVSDSRLVVRPDQQRLAQITHFKASETGQRQLFK